MSDVLSPNQRRTQAARSTFSEKFSSPEEKSAFYREIGSKGNSGRITLAPDEAERLRQAYAYIISLAPKLEKPADTTPDDSAA